MKFTASNLDKDGIFEMDLESVAELEDYGINHTAIEWLLENKCVEVEIDLETEEPEITVYSFSGINPAQGAMIGVTVAANIADSDYEAYCVEAEMVGGQLKVTASIRSSDFW